MKLKLRLRYLFGLLLVLLLLLPFAVRAAGGWPPPPRWVLVHQYNVDLAPNAGYFAESSFSGGNDTYKIRFDMYQSTGDNGCVDVRIWYGDVYAQDPSAPYYSIADVGWAYNYGGTFMVCARRCLQNGRLKGTVKIWRRDDM